MPILLHIEYSPEEIEINYEKFSSILGEIFNHLDFNKDNYINVILTDDDEIRNINKSYFDRDDTTDCITFPYTDNTITDENKTVIGDIYISTDTALRQSGDLEHSYRRELLHLIVHSLLHLQGWEDDTAEKRERMNQETDKILDEIIKDSDKGIV